LHIDQQFLQSSELTPASSDTVSPIHGLYGRKSPSYTSQRSPAVRVPQGPPSPEYTNLDCAFPPFPVTTPRSATPVQEPRASPSQLENEYVREHAEPYQQSRPASPSSSRHSRARSVVTSRSRNRSGTMGSRPDSVARPSTANGTRKPSLASISGGPKPAREERPPLPSTAFGSAASIAPKSRPPGFLGLKPGPSRAEGLADQMLQRRPSSPNRTQTFPLHNEDRISGNGPNSFTARRPSQPSPMLSTGRPFPAPGTSSLESLEGPGPTFRAYNPPHQILPAQAQGDMHPPRTPSRNSNRPPPVYRPFPVRKASRSDIRVDFTASNHPPLPTQTTISDSDLTNSSHTLTDSASPNASSASVAQTGNLRSSSPPGNETLARRRSKTRHGNDVAYTPLPDLAVPPKPALSLIPPDSPTDPLCLQGRLSPIPRRPMKRSPFSMTSSTSASSRTSSHTQSSQDLPIQRRNGGGNKGVCRGCSQPIVAGQKSISSKDGRLTGRYHKQCFACNTCRGPFETADFYVHDDHPFCAEHYHALNGSLCSGCGKGIEGQYLEATNKKDQEAEKFHPKCLTCSSCHTSLHDDYYEWMGKVYCERDAKRAGGVQVRSPNDTFLSPRPSPSPGSNLPGTPGALARPGLPAGPRAGLRPPGPGQAGNSFLSPSPLSGGSRAPPSGRRFPERRTTKLMMM